MSQIKLQDICVEYVQHLGSDHLIAQTAALSHQSHVTPEEMIPKLLQWKHLSPFEHAVITYDMKVPIFVARQLMRYRTASTLERSMRYVTWDGSIYAQVPPSARASCEVALETYEKMIAAGVPKEEARTVVPMCAMTDVRYTIDLRNLMHLLDERLAPSAQGETMWTAMCMKQIAHNLFPLSISE